MNKFLSFVETEVKGTYRAVNRKGETTAIIWFDPGWHKWVWQMYPDMQFDEDCTMDVLNFIRTLR